jgi:hypothetical protein
LAAPWRFRGLRGRFRGSADDFDARLESDPRFLARIEQARRELREGREVRLEDVLDL